MNWKRGWEVFRLVVSFIITFCLTFVFFAIVALVCFPSMGPLQGEVLGFTYDLAVAIGAWVWLSALAVAILRTHRAWRKTRAEPAEV